MACVRSCARVSFFLAGEGFLHICSEIGSLDMLKELLAMRLDVNMQDRARGETFICQLKVLQDDNGSAPLRNATFREDSGPACSFQPLEFTRELPSFRSDSFCPASSRGRP